jgi:polyferredoxin
LFFGQFLLGIVGFEKFLMTGELHLPVPALILSGPIYRGEVSFMTLLFISTVLLTGPAWCSHLCYFGAIDNLAAKGKSPSQAFQRKGKIKHIILLVVVLFAILFRFAGIGPLYALIGGIGIGVIGLGIIYFYSRKIKMMAHCTLFCPVGTLVMYLKYINPFRMVIDASCTQCGLCSGSCKYDALQMQNIARGKPGPTCTYCGDCLATCHQGAIRYKLLGLSSHKSRNIYLFLTVSIHVVFLALAKI